MFQTRSINQINIFKICFFPTLSKYLFSGSIKALYKTYRFNNKSNNNEIEIKNLNKPKISKNETEEMTNEQSRDITARNTNSKYAKQTLYLGLIDWCKNSSQIPSYDEDKPFIIDCNFHIDKKTSKFNRINIAITTKRLLNLALKRPDILICDASYKVI